MIKKIELTKAGYAERQAEYRNLIDEVRPEVLRQLEEARSQGDLSENADYDAARKRQAEVEGRIKELEDLFANCVIIEDVANKNPKKIKLGCTVTVKFLESGKEDSYLIVGTVESDPFQKKISNSCPLGEALIGRSVGDIVDVKSKKKYKVEVLKIETL